MRDERHHHDGVHRVQAAQLQHDEEQEEDDRAARVEQVLPFCRKHTAHKETK